MLKLLLHGLQVTIVMFPNTTHWIAVSCGGKQTDPCPFQEPNAGRLARSRSTLSTELSSLVRRTAGVVCFMVQYQIISGTEEGLCWDPARYPLTA